MPIYVIGHKNPDTDSVVSAIAYAEFKKVQGVEAVPAIQGDLNPETKLVLEKFGFSAPEKVTDAAGKQIILVDHGNLAGAPDHLTAGDLLEVIDHHKIGNITTDKPIFFQTKPVGCTCTIIREYYENNGVNIRHDIAGIMLCAILSDTILFKSPTTTSVDKKAAEELAKIAEVSDMKALAMELFKAKSAVEGIPAKDLVFRDFKNFEMGGHKIGIGQLELIDLSLIDGVRDDIYQAVEEVKIEGNWHSVFMMLTDIMKEGSELMVATDDSSVVEKAFGRKLEGKTIWIDGMMSRKKQTVPPLMKVFGS